jgi:hypothetical protein
MCHHVGDRYFPPVTTDDVTGFTKRPTHQSCPRSCSSALIHDVDHIRLPNARLVKRLRLPSCDDRKSVAEKNSIAVAWEFLKTVPVSCEFASGNRKDRHPAAKR